MTAAYQIACLLSTLETLGGPNHLAITLHTINYNINFFLFQPIPIFVPALRQVGPNCIYYSILAYFLAGK